MKFSQLILPSVTLLISASGHAAQQAHVDRLSAQIASMAAQLKLPPQRYLDAAHRFELLMAREAGENVVLDMEQDIQPLHALPAVNMALAEASATQAVSASTLQAMTREINQNKANLASYLGLDVFELERFLQLYGSRRHAALDAAKGGQ